MINTKEHLVDTYAREGHPNADALAKQIDALEGVKGG